MFESNGTGTTAAIDYANGYLVASLILYNQAGEVSIEDLAVAFGDGGAHHRGGDKGVVVAVLHGNSNTRNGKSIAIVEQRTFSVFDDSECNFWKSHGSLPSC